MTPKIHHAIAVVWLLGACEPLGQEYTTGASAQSGGKITSPQRPEGAPIGTCWEKDNTPAVIETITEISLVTPAVTAEDGTITTQAVYETRTRREISVTRREIWFETPCHGTITKEFVETLQRALAARGLYRGAITGRMDSRTRRAIRRYQAPLKLDSALLSLKAARKLGLIAVKRTSNTQ